MLVLVPTTLPTDGARGGAGRMKLPPYWATPQCILKRHLLARLPELRMGDCLRGPQEPALLRLVRPR